MSEPYDTSPYPPPPPNPAYAYPPGAYTNRKCMTCGYNLTGLTPGGTCPECGAYLPSPYAQPSSGLAITSMILGICSIPACFFYGLPGVIVGVIGLVLARMAKKQIATGQYADSSKGFMTAGFICSLVGTILGLIYMIFFIVFIAVMINSAPPPGSPSPYNPNYPNSPGPSYPSQWHGTPGGGTGLGNHGNPYTPNITPGRVQTGPRGLDSHGRPNLPNGVEYGPNGRIRPIAPNGLEYGAGGRLQPASPGGLPSPAGPSGPIGPSGPSPF